MIALFTLPLITGLAIAYYDRGDDVSLPLVEVVKVFAIVLLPVGDRHAGAAPARPGSPRGWTGRCGSARR